MRLVVAPSALLELRDAASFYALNGSLDLALAFVSELERAAELNDPVPLVKDANRHDVVGTVAAVRRLEWIEKLDVGIGRHVLVLFAELALI